MNAKLEPLKLNDEDRKSLSEVLGVPEDDLILTESEFAAHSECSTEFCETLLKTEWVQHDIQAVLAGTEKSGCQPWLLLNEQNRTVRLFSPSGATLLADACDEIELSAPFQKPGQAPVSAAAVLAWWEFLEQERKLFMDACRAGRAHDWRTEEEAAALKCVAEIEKRIPSLNSRRLRDLTAQWNAIEKCTVLCCKIATYCGDAANAERLAELITRTKHRWAALVEALCCTRWLDSDSPLAYLNRTTQTIYRQVRPERAGRDSQGMVHRAGQGRATKPSDPLHGFNTPPSAAGRAKKADPPPTLEELTFDYTPSQSAVDCGSLAEMVEEPSETVWCRRFTESSVRALEESAREDPLLTDYLKAVTNNPKRKRADIWRELGWSAQQGKAVDRGYRRVRKLLKAQGVGMEWLEAPGASDASKFFRFEVLQDGAKGNRFGVYQHKSLKIKGK